MKNVDTSSWKEFKLSELFDISTTRAIDRKNVIFTNEGAYDFIGRTSVGYGIQGRVDRLTYAPNPANTFSLVQVGETCCLFREREWYASQNIFMLAPKDKHLCDAQLFLTAVINKKLEPYKAAYTYPTLKVLQDLTILLPVKEIEEIDFEYMEARIREIEEARIKELEIQRIREKKEALRVMGLHDTQLTEEEELTIQFAPIIKKYRIDDVFEKIKTNKLPYKVKEAKSSSDEKYNLPALTAGIENQGLSCFVPRNGATILNNCISVSANGANTGAMFYQPDDFTVLQDSYAIACKWKNTGEKECLYLISAMQKVVKGNFDWSNKAGWEKIRSMLISLPANDKGEIDFHYMKTYITALQKLTIQKFYDDKGIFIDKAKEVCS